VQEELDEGIVDTIMECAQAFNRSIVLFSRSQDIYTCQQSRSPIYQMPHKTPP
jgi:hypothetical protein